jgi:hypothetical protein
MSGNDEKPKIKVKHCEFCRHWAYRGSTSKGSSYGTCHFVNITTINDDECKYHGFILYEG